MIVGIDGNEANIEKRVGVNQYAFELLKNLAMLSDEKGYKHQFIVFLKNTPLSDLPEENMNFRYKVIPGGGNWISTKLTPTLIKNKEGVELFFTPSHYVPPICPVPRVCSIMDLGYLEFSAQFRKIDFWQLKLWSAYSMYVSKRVIAISNSTKADILRHYPFASGRVRVTHLAYDDTQFNTKVDPNDVRLIKKRYSIVDDYVLFLSTLKPSKNVEGLLEAFALIKGDFPSLSLVVTGKKGWNYENIFKKVKDLGLSEKVIFTDFIPEKDKPVLVAGAKLLALPSFWEGFGLDVLNAQASGVPVVVSDKGSLPEVAGEAGVVVDPYSPESIAEGLKRVLTLNDIEYNKLVEAGLENVKGFSWRKTALETIKILEEAIDK
jgi:glycosyltransferase involved in cell wall biosynthesis